MVGTISLFAVLAYVLCWITAIVSAATTPRDDWDHVAYSKGLTIFLVFVTGGFGGAYYWLVIRRQLRL